MKQPKPRSIELLAPAKNLACGIEAIRHGADAVYMGAPKFGARAAAGNSLDDIAQLVAFAHQYYARVYITLNTILHEEELAETETLIHQLYDIGVDAIIVQDMGITRLNLPPIPLHASTQMDNRTVEKLRFLADAGFKQVVLARELSLQELSDIHQAVPALSLEVFVHGALCVSYSGQCYVSQACFGRSANRGECAQFCRLPFRLEDATGKTIVRDKHLLSLKDMNRLDQLEALLDAGASSLKIEGRLKDVSYVKNVTAAYRKQLDAIMLRRPEFRRASSGQTRFEFEPQLNKTFSRGFTDYYLHGRENEVHAFHSPKSLGEEVGHVKEVRSHYILVSSVKSFHNGDGLCYLDEGGKMKGFRVNRVEGNKIYPQEMPSLKPKTLLFRNFDQDFERQLSKPTAERKIGVCIKLTDTPTGFALNLTDEDNISTCLSFEREKEVARTPQIDTLKTQLSKLGNTVFEATEVAVELSGQWFLPASVLADWRRQAVESLERARRINYPREVAVWKQTSHAFPQQNLTYLANVSNTQAQAFYHAHGVQRIDPAYEKAPIPQAVLMFCKHCLRYSMGWCPSKQGGKSPYKEPYFLVSNDGRRFQLAFDCQACQMKVMQAL